VQTLSRLKTKSKKLKEIKRGQPSTKDKYKHYNDAVSRYYFRDILATKKEGENGTAAKIGI